MGTAVDSIVNVEQALANFVQNETIFRQTLIDRWLTTGRDINEECGYPNTVTINEYKKMYNREGVATKVVSCAPKETWSQFPEVYEKEDAEKTSFENTWEELVRDKRILHFLERVDILSGIGQYGILLMGLDDGKKLNQPVDVIDPQTERRKKDAIKNYKLMYLKPFDHSVLEIKEKEKNTSHPRFGKPLMYSVKMESESGDPVQNVDVHWTRVLHIADNRDTSDVYGIPRMQPVYNRLLDIRKIVGGSAEMFFKGGFPGYSFEVNPDAIAPTLDTESLKEEIEEYFKGLRRYFAVQGITAKSMTPQVADPTPHVYVQMKIIAMTIDIPFRILLGSEEGKLASTQDKRLWSERITKRRIQYVIPMVVRPFVDRLLDYGVLPQVEKYFVKWPDRGAASDRDIADVARIRAQALKDFVQGDVREVMTREGFLTTILRLSPEEAAALTKDADSEQATLEADEIEFAKRMADATRPPKVEKPAPKASGGVGGRSGPA